MNISKRKNGFLFVGGILFSCAMCAGLANAFVAVPDGSSPAKLAQAIGIWAAGAALGAAIFFVGLGRMISARLHERRGERTVEQ